MARGGKKCRTWSKYLSFLFHFLFLSQGPSFPPKTCSVCLSALVCRLQVWKEPTPLNDSCRWLCAWHGSKTVVALPAQTRARCSCYADIYIVVVPALCTGHAHSNLCNKDRDWVAEEYCQLSCFVNGAGYSDVDCTEVFVFWGFFYGGWGRKPFFYSRDLFSGSAILSRLLSSCFV